MGSGAKRSGVGGWGKGHQRELSLLNRRVINIGEVRNMYKSGFDNVLLE